MKHAIKFLERATAEAVELSNEGIFSRKLPVGESEKILCSVFDKREKETNQNSSSRNAHIIFY